MALASSTIAALAIAAAAAGASAYNTRQTANRQDRTLAEGIRGQSRKQEQIDQRTAAEVAQLEQSRSADEAAKARTGYDQQLQRNAAAIMGGLTPGIGSETFKADAAQGAKDVSGYAGRTADLMARMDAPGMQRQGEAFGMGRLATDNALVAREAQGDDFLNRLRVQGIRRNPWIDAAAQVGMAYAGGMAGGAGSAAGTGSSLNANAMASGASLLGNRGGVANGYYLPPNWG